MAELEQVFAELKPVFEAYDGPFVARTDTGSSYQLYTVGPVRVDGREYAEFAFAGLRLGAKHVTIDYMPVYLRPDLRDELGGQLRPLLKTKSCFHLRSAGEAVCEQVRDALELGLDLYRRNGWVDAR